MSLFPLTSGRKRTTLERPDLKSENTGLLVELHMFNMRCASFQCSFNIIFLVSSPNPEINMASLATSLSLESDVHVEEQGVNFALQVIGRENLTLKEKQMQILRTVIVEKKDALAVLPSGFGKSLVYQLMALFADFVESGFRPTEMNSIALVVSPLNALIRDHVTKLRECGLKACILKGDCVALDGEEDDREQVCISEPLENLKNFQLIYAHPEALVENKAVMQLLKTMEFQRRVRAIVVDEAHLVVDWYVNFIITF